MGLDNRILIDRLRRAVTIPKVKTLKVGEKMPRDPQVASDQCFNYMCERVLDQFDREVKTLEDKGFI